MTVGKVKDFSFPTAHGFSGSAGKGTVHVKSHLRTTPMSQSVRTMNLHGKKGGYDGGTSGGGAPLVTNPDETGVESEMGPEVAGGFRKGGRAKKHR
jgi:hypothetical protein